MALTHREALEVLAAHRGQHLGVATHGSVDLWMSLSDTPLDFSYVPTSMGQGPALGLGLAQSRHGVVVVCGDGHLLMNLGCLVTTAHFQPPNLYHFVLENGVYGTTGGQPIPGQGQTDFAGLARAAVIPEPIIAQHLMLAGVLVAAVLIRDRWTDVWRWIAAVQITVMGTSATLGVDGVRIMLLTYAVNLVLLSAAVAWLIRDPRFAVVAIYCAALVEANGMWLGYDLLSSRIRWQGTVHFVVAVGLLLVGLQFSAWKGGALRSMWRVLLQR